MMTAGTGLVGFFFIDNAAHAGGVVTGFCAGAVATGADRTGGKWPSRFNAAGYASGAILLVGAVFHDRTPVALVVTQAPAAFQDSQGRRFRDCLAGLATALAIGLSLYSLYWVLFIVQPQIYRVSFLLVALVLIFCSFRRGAGSGDACGRLDWAADRLPRSSRWPGRSSTSRASSTAPPIRCRSTSRSARSTIVLVLEATRRSVGWILPATAIGFHRLRAGRAGRSIASAWRSSRTAATSSIGSSARST